MTSNFLLSLNTEQYAAVTLPAQSALIIAGAGSGKTRVLTTRIAWLIKNQHVRSSEFLAVTFTNKAAREMMQRLSKMLQIDTNGMWIGTFHGLCNRFLRMHWKNANLPNTFQILDTSDQLSLIKRLLKKHNVNPKNCLHKDIQDFINNAKEKGLRATQMNSERPSERFFVQIYMEYENQCECDGLVDFPELLLRSYEILKLDERLRTHYQERFCHILVDEFQDTNYLQYRWLRMLAGKRNAVFAVGDDDQSIYGFRGANINNIFNFENEFSVKHRIKLEQNYRSHGHILNAANHLISRNSHRLLKTLHTTYGIGEPVHVYKAVNDQKEASWIARKIQSFIENGVTHNEIAILYRSNTQSRVIEHALVAADIPYKIYGGFRFFERKEIKHAISYLRLLNNPHDNMAFLQVVNFPARGIGIRSLEILINEAQLHKCSLFAAINLVTEKVKHAMKIFLELLERIRSETITLNLVRTLEYIITKSGLEDYYKEKREGWKQLENLQELINAVATFCLERGYGENTPARSLQNTNLGSMLDEFPDTGTPISDFLSHIALETTNSNEKSIQNAVQLMTVHAAKGLEFTVVFITGLEEGLFPHENSMLDKNGLEEERRLLYVAITRAKKQLYLSFSENRMLHGRLRYSLRSRFFDELPSGTLHWINESIENSMSWNKDFYFQISKDVESVLANKKRTANMGYYIGQKIIHKKFGEGTIISLEGKEIEKRAQVTFRFHGTKWLSLSMAKLQTIS